MDMISVIEKKKLGKELTQEEIEYFVQGAATGSVPDYQLAAMLMAIVADRLGKPLNELRFISIREIRD